MEFIDDYRLLVSLVSVVDPPPSIVVMDTRKDVGGIPMQTFFRLPPNSARSGNFSFLLERGVHKPSPAERLAPFHQDHSQRIVVLDVQLSAQFLVLRVGALLELLESCEGDNIGWDEWKSRVVIPSINLRDVEVVELGISGCQLFAVFSTFSVPGTQMEVYDFSMRGRAKCLSREAGGWLGGVRTLPRTGIVAQVPPQGKFYDVYNGHDSIALSHVSVRASYRLCHRD